ncbi:hypothetical protein ACWDAO_17575, partial [Streptomyces sp. NPDC001212]
RSPTFAAVTATTSSRPKQSVTMCRLRPPTFFLLNIRNDSRRGVEVFRGATCDNGAPIATVGPCSEANGVKPGRVHGGVRVKDGVVASFRVVGHRKGDFDDFGDFGDFGDFDDFGF